MQARGPFVHRRNANLTFDSICTRCIATVSYQQKEENDLATPEADHVCDDRLLEARERWLRIWNGGHILPSDHQGQ